MLWCFAEALLDLFKHGRALPGPLSGCETLLPTIRRSWWWAALEDRLLWFVCLAPVRFVAAVGTLRALRVCCFLLGPYRLVRDVRVQCFDASCYGLRCIHSRLLSVL